MKNCIFKAVTSNRIFSRVTILYTDCCTYEKFKKMHLTQLLIGDGKRRVLLSGYLPCSQILGCLQPPYFSGIDGSTV